MLVSDFEFELPAELIADVPVRPRDASRLLAYDRRQRGVEHRVFRDLPGFLAPDDLLVLNNTEVLPHRLHGRRETGGRVEVLILERAGATCRGYVKPFRKIRPGEQVPLEGGALVLTAESPSAEPAEGILTFRLETPDGSDVEAALQRVGRAPLPPYIVRDGSEDAARDRRQYQTVFAEVPGAVAAPTAGYAKTHVEEFYQEAEIVVHSTNEKVQRSVDLLAELRKECLLSPEPFDEPIDFIAFDLWHYYGRTAKHGAFMGGADFVQWHGNYELLVKMVEMEEIAKSLRGKSISEMK